MGTLGDGVTGRAARMALQWLQALASQVAEDTAVVARLAIWRRPAVPATTATPLAEALGQNVSLRELSLVRLPMRLPCDCHVITM